MEQTIFISTFGLIFLADWWLRKEVDPGGGAAPAAA